VSRELRADMLRRRTLDKDGDVRVRAGPRAPVRESVQELFDPVHGPEIQACVRSHDQARVMGPREGEVVGWGDGF
jgi:hypothetical protein